jgi:hypothetical protein
MVLRKPQQRVRRVSRQKFRNDAKSVNVGSDGCKGNGRAFAAIQTKAVGENPS